MASASAVALIFSASLVPIALILAASARFSSASFSAFAATVFSIDSCSASCCASIRASFLIRSACSISEAVLIFSSDVASSAFFSLARVLAMVSSSTFLAISIFLL